MPQRSGAPSVSVCLYRVDSLSLNWSRSTFWATNAATNALMKPNPRSGRLAHTRALCQTPSLAVLGWEVEVQKVVNHGVRKEVGASPDHHSVHDPATTAGALAELEPGIANVQFNVPVELKHAALVVYGQRYRHLRELEDTGQLGPTPKQC